MNKKIREYLPMVDFLYYLLGKNYEIVLEDFTIPEQGIIAIRNNYLSKRNAGDPVAAHVLEVLRTGQFPPEDIVVSYITKTEYGLPIRAVCYMIREDEEILGMLAVNIDDSLIYELENIVRTLRFNSISYEDDLSEITAPSDTWLKGLPYLKISDLSAEKEIKTPPKSSLEERICQETNAFAQNKGIASKYLQQEDRMEIIRKLYVKGTFEVKGAVAICAKILHVSEPTVYRYLQNIKKELND